jgi:hypothetical protein
MFLKLVSRNNGTIKIVDLQTRGKPLDPIDSFIDTHL